MRGEEIHGMESFGRVIRAQRRARGWSLTTAARKLGVTPPSLGMYERGERNPSMDTIVRLLYGYGLHLLVTDTPELATIRQARIEALRRELAELEGAA